MWLASAEISWRVSDLTILRSRNPKIGLVLGSKAFSCIPKSHTSRSASRVLFSPERHDPKICFNGKAATPMARELYLPMHVGLECDRGDSVAGFVLLSRRSQGAKQFSDSRSRIRWTNISATAFANTSCTDKDRRAARVCMNSQLHA